MNGEPVTRPPARRFAGLLHGADYNYEQWLDRPDVLDADLDLMVEAGCNVMSVGIFSWAKYEPAEGRYDFDWMDGLLDRLFARGIRAILATPSGSKPAWLSQAYPEVCRMDVHGRREAHAGRHNHCRTSPVYRRKCRELNGLLARRYGGHPGVILWHVSNEYNSGRCWCPACLDAFRAWLRHRYGSLEALNKAWWTDFWSHRFGAWEEIYPADSSINGMMLDWARFTSDQTLDFFREEIAPLREFSPHIPVTTNFMHPDVGLDYYKFARELDLVSWDSYPEWHREGDDPAVAARAAFCHDFYRSLKDQPFLLMESTPSNTNWQGVSPLKRPNLHHLSSLQAIAHGSDSVQYFQWRQSRGGEEKFHGAVLTHLGADTRSFREVCRVGASLARLGSLARSPVKAEVALIYDFESSWALDLAQLPRSLAKGYQAECLAHYRAFWNRGIAVDVRESTAADLGRYKLVVAPMLYLLRPGVAAGLGAYVAAGGTLVSGYLSGLVDESDLCFPGGAPGPLAPLFGLRVEETDALPDQAIQALSLGGLPPTGPVFALRHYADRLRLEGATPRGWYCHDFLAGEPALTSHVHGKGTAWYLAARAGADFLDAFHGGLADSLGLARALPGTLPAGVSAVRRGTGPDQVVFVMNFTPAPMELDLAGPDCRDALTGQALSGRQTIGPYDLLLLTAPPA